MTSDNFSLDFLSGFDEIAGLSDPTPASFDEALVDFEAELLDSSYSFEAFWAQCVSEADFSAEPWPTASMLLGDTSKDTTASFFSDSDGASSASTPSFTSSVETASTSGDSSSSSASSHTSSGSSSACTSKKRKHNEVDENALQAPALLNLRLLGVADVPEEFIRKRYRPKNRTLSPDELWVHKVHWDANPPRWGNEPIPQMPIDEVYGYLNNYYGLATATQCRLDGCTRVLGHGGLKNHILGVSHLYLRTMCRHCGFKARPDGFEKRHQCTAPGQSAAKKMRH